MASSSYILGLDSSFRYISDIAATGSVGIPIEQLLYIMFPFITVVKPVLDREHLKLENVE